MKITSLFGTVLFLVLMPIANAQMQKCIVDGVTTYSDKPCTTGAEAKRLTQEEVKQLSKAKEQQVKPDEKAKQKIQAEFDKYAKPIAEQRKKDDAECKAWMAQPAKIVNSSWDGSVRSAEKYLKQTVRDPDSLVTEKWFPVTKTCDGYMVSVVFRAKNAFGGYVRNTTTILITKDGVAYSHM